MITIIRLVVCQDQKEEMQAEVNDNSTDEDEKDDQLKEENRARMLIIQNNSKYHGLETDENQKSFGIMRQKTNINL